MGPTRDKRDDYRRSLECIMRMLDWASCHVTLKAGHLSLQP